MALVLKDRVKETSVSTGTGAITLDGATGAYQPFSVIGNGNTTYYCIAGQTTNEWEVGIGTYTLSTDTLSRDTILSSSNSNAIVNFSAGTKDVFITYPSEKAIYEEADGDTLINAGPITVLGPGVSGVPTPYSDTLGRFYGNVNSFQQVYVQNQFNGTDASSDIVAYNNLGDGTNYFVDMGMSGSTYSSGSYPIFTANSAYLYNSGLTTGTGAAGETSELFVGTGTLNSDLVLFTGGVNTTNEAVRISGADQTIEVQKGVTLNETLDVTGAASFGSTVLLDANPTLALQAATKQYVDNAVTAGVHIHEPVRVVAASNLTATYAQGGTTFNITTITSTTTVTTSVNHGLSVNDQIWLTSTAGNGLSTNTAYFVYSTPALNQLTLSLTFGGAQITGLTNATGLTYATRANSGVGATLTNSGAQAALSIDGVSLSSTNRVLVRGQTNAAENGAYTVTTVGSGSTNWVLTRATDSNTVNPSDPDGLGTGDYFFVQEGLTGTGDSFVLTTEPNTMIIGYTALTYTQFSGAITYVGGTNIDVTGQTISLTGTVAATNGGTGVNTVTTGDILYGSATNTWSKLGLGAAYQSIVVNGSGTQVEWNAVNLSSSAAVTGSLGPTFGGTGQTTYALGDTLYSSASNTLTKLSGNTSTTKQYLSQTGTGSASAAPSWATIDASDIGAGTLSAVRGGTGQSSYSIGDILYADTTTSLARLADVAVGNALISGGLNVAPAWGKIALASAVSGTLGIANGGTGQTTANAAFNALVPSQTGNSGRYLTTNGTDTSWGALSAVSTISFGTTGLTPNTATSGAVVVSGTLAIANGGTGETTRQAAMDTLAGATTAGQYLRGNGTDVVMANIVAGDVPTLNQNTTGTAGGLSGSPSISVGTVTTTAGSAAIPAITTTGDTNTGIFFPAADTIAFTEGGAESMRIHASGGVSIGNTTDPSANNVTLGNSAATAASNFNALNSGGQTSFGTQGTSAYGALAAGDGFVYTTKHVVLASDSASGAIKFGTGSGIPERMRIDSSGRVGIGTASPRQLLSIGSTLDIYSGGNNTPTVASIRATNNLVLNGFSTGAVFLNFDTGTGGVNFCNGGGTVTAAMSSAGGLSAVSASFRTDTTTAGSESNILIQNVTSGTTPYYIGGLFGIAYRDVRSPAYVAGIDFYRTSAAGGLASTGEIRFYTSGAGETQAELRAGAERMRIHSSGGVSIGNTTDPGAGDLSVGGSSIFLTNATTNNIIWNTAGVAAPTATTRSAGTKLVLYPGVGSGSNVDFGFGIENATLWSSVAATSEQFKWYGGTTLAATLTGTGNLTAVGTVTATNHIGAGTGLTGTATSLSIGGNAATATLASATAMSSGRTDSTAYPVVWGVTGASSQLYSCTAVNIQSSTGTLNATRLTATPNTSGVGTGITAVNGDLTAYRSGGTTGVVYLSSSGNHYLFWDGTNYNLNAGNLVCTNNITVGNGQTNSYIFMSDSNEGTREIHCNANRIGFTNQAGAWGSYCNDDGSWITDFNLGIGTSTPDGRLDVAGNATLRGDGNTSFLSFGVPFGRGYFAYSISAGNTWDMYNVQNGPIRFYTNSTERVRIDGNGNLNFNSGFGSAGLAYGCRVWVNFNGQGTVAIRASGNVSSITDNGVGRYAINFTTAMPDTNYNCVGTCSSISGRGQAALMVNETTGILVNPTTTSTTVLTYHDAGGPIDPQWVMASVFR